MFTNERRVCISDFDVDPSRAWADLLLEDTASRVQGLLVAPVIGADHDPEQTYGGAYARSPQSFRGAASPAATNVVYRNGGHPEISSGIVEGPMGDPARRMFAARLRRGKPAL